MNMKKYLMFVVVALLAMPLVAQKSNPYQESFNFKRALEIMQNDGDENEALEYLRKEIGEHPKNGYAYYMMGVLYSENGQPGDAIAPMDKAIVLLKKDKDWITYAYRQRAKICLALEDEEGAMRNWALALKADPKDVDTYGERGDYYYQKDMYELSTADFQMIRSIQPGNTYGHMGVGRNLLEQGELAEALKMFSYCVSLDPSYSQAYAFRAETEMKMGNMASAIDDMVTALGIDGNSKAFYLLPTVKEPDVVTLIAKLKVQQIKQPNEGLWSYYLGQVYKGQGEYTKAIEWYGKANSLNTSDVICQQISICYMLMDDNENALKYIDQALNLDSTDLDYRDIRATILYDMGRIDDVVAEYDRILTDAPEYSTGYYQRGWCKYLRGEKDEAVEDLTMAIVLSPQSTGFYQIRGSFYREMGKTDLAEADFRKIIELEDSVEKYECVFFAYEGLGENEKAIEALNLYLETDTTDAGRYYNAACLYSRMGDKDKALAYLEEALQRGSSNFSHMWRDIDLKNIRGTSEFKALLEKYEKQPVKVDKNTGQSNTGEMQTTEIPFTKEGGVCQVKCTVNDLPLYFVFDTGASTVSLSMVEATFMMKNGYLKPTDVVGRQRYMDANGNVSEGTEVNLRCVKFGESELANVRASVVRNQKAPLLLGQSVLGRLGKIEIDNEANVIRVKYMK